MVKKDCSNYLGIHGAVEVCAGSSSFILWSVWKVYKALWNNVLSRLMPCVNSINTMAPNGRRLYFVLVLGLSGQF
jgi:hypothetical protein